MHTNNNMIEKASDGWMGRLREQDWKFYAGLITTLALAGLGVSALYYSTRSNKGKKVKSKKDFKKGNEDVEHLLEEVVPDPHIKNGDKAEFVKAFTMRIKEIKDLATDEKEHYSKILKEGGNILYREKKFSSAISTYSKALHYSNNAIFFANRAACYAALDQHLQVIEDCTNAIALDHKYSKAYARRANAYEALDHTREALDDYVAAYILSKTANNQAKKGAARVIEQISERESDLIFREKVQWTPSKSLLSAFFQAFDFVPTGEIIRQVPGDTFFIKAVEYLKKKDYEAAYESLNQTIEAQSTYSIQARIIRGCYYFLMRSYDALQQDVEKIFEEEPNNINAYILKAHLTLEHGHYDVALKCVSDAMEIEPNNKMLYYQLAQLNFMAGEGDDAILNYKKAIEIDNNYFLAKVQLGVALLKAGKHEESIEIYEQLVKDRPNDSEAHNYYGELLMSMNMLDKVDQQLDAAIKCDPNNPMPLVNKAFIMVDQGNFDKANEFLVRAVEVDNRSELIHASLAQSYGFLLQFREAAECYQNCIEVAKTKQEIKFAVEFKEACLAQLRFIENHPDKAMYIKETYLLNYSKENKYL